MAFTTEELENLSALMLASDDDNTRLAFEILDAQPETEFPKELITEIFVVYKMSKHKDYQDKAKKILDKLGSPALHKSMARKFDLGQGSAVEPTIEKSIEKFITGTELDGVKFSRALYNKYGSGILYLLNHLPNADCKKFLETFINGTSFRLTKKELNTIPKVFFEYTKLTEIDLTSNKFGTIYKEFKAFADLKVLKMSSNSLKKIPKDIAKLTKLEVLDISDNLFGEFPEVVGELRNLRELNLAKMGGYWTKMMEFPTAFTQLKHLRKLTLSHQKNGEHPFLNYPFFSTIESDSSEAALDLSPIAAALRAWAQQRQGVGYLLEFGDTAVIQEIIQHFYDAATQTLNLSTHLVSFLPKELANFDIRHFNFYGMGLGYSNTYWAKNRSLENVLEGLAYMPNLESLDIRGNVFDHVPPSITQLKNLRLLKASIWGFDEEKLMAEVQQQLPNCKIEKGH